MSTIKEQLVTASEVIELLQADIDALVKICDDMDEGFRRAHAARFIERGGCQDCNGTGYVDVPHCGYSEFCSNPWCSWETRAKTGINSAVILGSSWSCQEHKLLEPMLDRIGLLQDCLAWLHSTPRKHERVIVTKGRKVPKGTTGVIVWVGEGRPPAHLHFRMRVPLRVGVKDDSGTVHWTSSSNVERVF